MLFDSVLVFLGVVAVALGIYNWLINHNLDERLRQLVEQSREQPSEEPE
jgi:hypothetical protein